MDFNTEHNFIDERIKGKAQKYGICGNCSHLRFRLFRNGRESAGCALMWDKPIPLYEYRPIVDCLNFVERGRMNLMEMQKIATIIEISKHVAGFRQEDDIKFISPESRQDEF